MAVRPNKCYRDVNKRAYTRIAYKVPKKNFVGGVPGLKIRLFEMGKPFPYDYELAVLALTPTQIRDSSLESIRLILSKKTQLILGKNNYWIRLLVYPHMILRENKVAVGGHADRISDGMAHSFGKPIGRAARVKSNQKIAVIYANDLNKLNTLKNSLSGIKSKISCSVGFSINEVELSQELAVAQAIKEEVIEEKEVKETESSDKEKEKKSENKEEKKSKDKNEKKEKK